ERAQVEGRPAVERHAERGACRLGVDLRAAAHDARRRIVAGAHRIEQLLLSAVPCALGEGLARRQGPARAQALQVRQAVLFLHVVRGRQRALEVDVDRAHC
ncbi:hypothetical protein RZS08_58160, partial [Arthrospira platensis SPKY1]|nr:hypothetical protein [Arthrospira platensis SPKY1]